MFADANNVGMVHLPAGDWITVADAAGILEVTPRRVQVFINAGRLKATKMSKRLFLLLRDDVVAFKSHPRPVGKPTDKPKAKGKKKR